MRLWEEDILEQRRSLDRLAEGKFQLQPVEAEVRATKFVPDQPKYDSVPEYEYVQVPSGYGKYRTTRTEKRVKGYKTVRSGTHPAHWEVSLVYDLEGTPKTLAVRVSGTEHLAPEEDPGWEVIRRAGNEAGVYVVGNRYRLYYNAVMKQVHSKSGWDILRRSEERGLRWGLDHSEESLRKFVARGPKILLLRLGSGVGLFGVLLMDVGRRRRRWIGRLIREGRRRVVIVESEELLFVNRRVRFSDPDAQPPVKGRWKLGGESLRPGPDPRTAEALVHPARPDRYYPLVRPR